MKKSHNFFPIIILAVSCFCFSGCQLLQIPGAIIGGAAKVGGAALGVAKKLPWWMAL